jgi:hypothetical protein
MMGGGAFILLKAGGDEPESTKQAEIRLASLLKILRFAGFDGRNLLAGWNPHAVVVSVRLPRDMANSPGIARFVI